MLKIFVAFSFIFIIFSSKNYAQSENVFDSLKLARRIEIQNNLIVLRNQNEIIPIQALENKRIACVSIGNDTLNTFTGRLADYASIKVFNLQKTEIESYSERIKSELKSYNLIICALHDIDENKRNSYGLTAQMGKMVGFLKDSLNSIIVVFGNQQSLTELKGIENAAALVLSPNESTDNQDLTAQLIFGGISAKGKLNTDINTFFTKGYGIDTKGGIRFKFTIPEEINIKSYFLNKKIDSIAENGLKQKAYPGCQIIAAKDGKVFFYKTYGYQTFDSLIPVNKKDLYDLASITKITGALPGLIKLYDDHKLSIDSKLSDYITSFKNSDKKDITFREALTHQAGFVPFIPFYKKTIKKNKKFKWHTFKTDSSRNYPYLICDSMYLYKNYPKKIYKTIRKTKLNEKKVYLYSDLSFLLYPKIIETIIKGDYETFLENNFYKKIGANSFTYNPIRKIPKEMIIPTEMDSFFRKRIVHGFVHDESAAMLAGVSGNAGLFASGLDLAKIMQMYLNMGKYGGQQLISENTMKEFTRCQFPQNNNRRALGFDKPPLDKNERGSAAVSAGPNSFGHTGFTGTMCWVDPDNGLLFVFMSNRVYPTRNNSKLYELNIRPNLHQIFYDAINGAFR